jgi:long-chain acyl-CoA synthetase
MAELIAPIAERKGDEPALIDESGTTTWSQFDERVNRFVNGLRGLGFSDGDTFALMAGNRREAFEAHVGSAHGSWVIVPVNWHWTAEELAYVVNDSGARALIVDDRFAEIAHEAAAALVDCPVLIAMSDEPPVGFLSYEEVLSGADASEPEEQRSGGPMFYTSGTTGFPKGVRGAVSNSGGPPAMLQLLAGTVCGMFDIPTEGVTLLDGPLYHSAQWVFSLVPLALGSTVVMRHHFDPTETLRAIDEQRVTNLHLVPTQFIRLLKLPDDVRSQFDGSSLASVVHGAAPCPPEVKRKMLEWWGPIVTEYYGGTEGGFLTVITGKEWLEHPGSLGRETALVELLIIGDDGKAVPTGEAGQIYFKSKLGSDFQYHNAPEKTAAAHLEPGVGTLGDVGYVDDEGYLYLSDRKIDMIISGGVNIYPAEIEGVLVGHPAVADAAVFGIPDDEMGEQVKAVVELSAGFEGSDELAADIVAHVREHLAGYKVPRSVDFTDELPRHPTGKLYKRLLRDPYWEGTGRAI